MTLLTAGFTAKRLLILIARRLAHSKPTTSTDQMLTRGAMFRHINKPL